MIAQRKLLIQVIFIFTFFMAPLHGEIFAGFSERDLTPSIDTPMAGYGTQMGRYAKGVHDPLLARSISLKFNDKTLTFCSVDHLGFTTDMVQEVKAIVKQKTSLAPLYLFISSSHTHSGAGAFLNIPGVSEALAGPFDPEVRALMIQKTAESIIESTTSKVPVKLGIGYGHADDLTLYRGAYPKELVPPSQVSILKITDLEDRPLYLLFNFAAHPTLLKADNELFSADWVYFTRKALESKPPFFKQSLFINGAQGDVLPYEFNSSDQYLAAELFGNKLAHVLYELEQQTQTSEDWTVNVIHKPYRLNIPKEIQGGSLSQGQYPTELNLILFNQTHAFLTVPGELSCFYDQQIGELARHLGYDHLSIFGLTNDAHGYIIPPKSYEMGAYESTFSFGGPDYGNRFFDLATDLLKNEL